MRFRIDGVLVEQEPAALKLGAAIVSCIKIMARLNIAERRLPQDGRVKTVVRGRGVDLRVSTLPTLHGESVVSRILDREAVNLDFAALGFTGRERRSLRQPQPHGDILLPRAIGCEKCGGRGFSGRTALIVTMPLSERLRRLVLGRASAGEIMAAAAGEGFRTMFGHGIGKVLAGETTLGEVLRVTRAD